MGKLGIGYGSEWHLLWYLARHRGALDDAVRTATRADSVEWLDFPVRPGGDNADAEWKGLDFLQGAEHRAAWAEFWPQGSGIHNWDAVGTIRVGERSEWLLVEAKANCEEIRADCGAKPTGGLAKIQAALDVTKRALGVDPARDWLQGYYQFCNRLAVLQFLTSRGTPAHLLTIYFTGDVNGDRACPEDEAGWGTAIEAQAAHVGLPLDHALSKRVHKVFLGAFGNVTSPLRDFKRLPCGCLRHQSCGVHQGRQNID